MSTASSPTTRIADRVWIATALLQKEFPQRSNFTKQEIREKLDAEGLSKGVERSTISANLDQHCVANVPPSSGKYRMLFEDFAGNLRLFCVGDPEHPGRTQRRKPSKIVPRRDETPSEYWPLLDWYESWTKDANASVTAPRWEDDPLIRLIGSGRHVWADEHADDYVNRLRNEDPA